MVYLLHFSEPYQHARHYIGAADDLQTVLNIIAQPATYSGSPLLLAADAAGVRFQLAQLVPGGSVVARRLRARKRTAAICSVCRDARRRAEVV